MKKIIKIVGLFQILPIIIGSCSSTSTSLSNVTSSQSSSSSSSSDNKDIEVYDSKVSINIQSNRNGTIVSPSDVTITETFNSIESKRQYNTQTLPSIGDVKILVIPVKVPEYTSLDIDDNGSEDSEKVREDIEKAFFGETDNYHESVASYYYKSSYGKLRLSGTVTDWYNIEEDASLEYTTATEITLDETYNVVEHAISWAKEQGIDTTEYDYDKDGYIDGVWLVYSAPDYSNGGPYTDDYNYWAYTTWGNQTGDSAQKPNVNDPVYNLFGWASYDFMYEGYGSGVVDAHTFIHETGHFLGLADYYSDLNTYSPIGKVDMMDGNIIDQNSYSKMLLGWTKPYLALGSGTIDLSCMENENSFIVIPNDDREITNNEFDPFSEYILIELYTNEGLNYLDSRLKLEERPLAMNSKGVRIYHIDNRKFLLDKTEAKYTSKVYEGETIDSNHRIILPLSNMLSPDTYNNNFNVPKEVNLFDEIRLIEATNNDTFSSGGYQTDKTLFKANSSFSLSKFSTFFTNNGKFDDGSECTCSVTIGEIK